VASGEGDPRYGVLERLRKGSQRKKGERAGPIQDSGEVAEVLKGGIVLAGGGGKRGEYSPWSISTSEYRGGGKGRIEICLSPNPKKSPRGEKRIWEVGEAWELPMKQTSFLNN